MAGEAELVGDTLVAALRDAVASVEDEHGVTIEFSAIVGRMDFAGADAKVESIPGEGTEVALRLPPPRRSQ